MAHRYRGRTRSLFLPLVLLFGVGLLVVSCSQESEQPVQPTDLDDGIQMGLAHPAVRGAVDVQERHTPDLMARDGVVGTAVTLTSDGRPAIMILLETEAARRNIPAELDGVPVVIRVTGPINAVKGPPGGSSGGGGADHTARQTRPIPLGVSGGNVNDLANGYCCSGTLGSLVEDGSGKQYILSNSHVFAGDIASSGGDPDISQIGDPINQPGLIDVSCQTVPADFVANLSSLSSIAANPPSGNVDAAIAQVIAGQVDPSGTILEIGTISTSPVPAQIRQKVKKSGRTSGLTRSRVDGLNATVNVGYEDECNGNSFVRTFTGQILVKGGGFLQGGDSGSLMVEDVSTDPAPVGLLYASGGGVAVAMPIQDVLAYLNDLPGLSGVHMVGN